MLNEEVREFIVESAEVFDKIEAQLLALEGRHDDVQLIDELMRHYHSIKGLSGFFGLSFTESVCHICEDLLIRIKTKQVTFDNQLVSTLISALDALRHSVKRLDESYDSSGEFSPENYGNVIAQLTQFNLFSPAKGLSETNGEEPHKIETSSRKSREVRAQHSNKPIYAVPLMRVGRHGLTAQDAWLLTSLLRLKFQGDAEPSSQSICEEALSIMKSSKQFADLDRICLVRIHSYSNLLEIVACSQSQHIRSENMAPGYRCFVSPTSTLFELKSGEVRVFSDIDSVLDSYKSADKPPQRSIRLIAEGGFKSGICIPLFMAARVRGLLFFNSGKKGFFDSLSDSQAMILCALQVLLEGTLMQHLFPGHVLEGEFSNRNDLTAIFDKDLLIRELTTALSAQISKTPRISLEGVGLKDCLIPYPGLRRILIDIILLLYGYDEEQLISSPIRLNAQAQGNQIWLSLKSGVALSDSDLISAFVKSLSFSRIKTFGSECSLDVDVTGGDILIKLPFEKVNLASPVLYST